MEGYLVRPKLRSETNKIRMRTLIKLHLKDWMRLPLDVISKAMTVRRHQDMAGPPSAVSQFLRHL